jgi:hypothetical protein
MNREMNRDQSERYKPRTHYPPQNTLQRKRSIEMKKLIHQRKRIDDSSTIRTHHDSVLEDFKDLVARIREMELLAERAGTFLKVMTQYNGELLYSGVAKAISSENTEVVEIKCGSSAGEERSIVISDESNLKTQLFNVGEYFLDGADEQYECFSISYNNITNVEPSMFGSGPETFHEIRTAKPGDIIFCKQGTVKKFPTEERWLVAAQMSGEAEAYSLSDIDFGFHAVGDACTSFSPYSSGCRIVGNILDNPLSELGERKISPELLSMAYGSKCEPMSAIWTRKTTEKLMEILQHHSQYG